MDALGVAMIATTFNLLARLKEVAERNHMARRKGLTVSQRKSMNESEERMMRTVMPKTSSRSEEPMNGWPLKKSVVEARNAFENLFVHDALAINELSAPCLRWTMKLADFVNL